MQFPMNGVLTGVSPTRKCTKCGEVKPLDCFGKRKLSKDGLRLRCKDCQREDNRRWRAANLEKHNQYQKEWAKKNPDKRRSACKNWDRKNNLYYRAKNNKRRAKLLRRTPPWADLEAIKEFYMNCPDGYHVDHIIPLRGELVSGLHILQNLQYLPALDNLRKSNKF